ncbi:cytochrome P450 [Lederbergia sp. NSJ-179]|uniref:cytochrome P450 family protein n=1 Tax=Lederbergia sp. NSJ-179 TaxID=2931402 RepID=UPI001FD0DE5C|nr:cytochrome P450 [Lederbergia sp. NSJ-179]MCJ7840876.1 cytochrome P450 [Lederbergia sp. NSJ-179]
MNTPDQTIPEKVASNLFSDDGGELTTNPFPLFAELRSIGPVVPIPFPMEGTDRKGWMVTQLKEAVQILKDHAHFTVDPRSIDGSVPIKQKQNLDKSDESSDSPTFFTGSTMLTVDDPDHRRLRMLVSKAFTPRFIEGLRPRVQEIADELLDQVQDQGEMDLIKDYAFPLPINVISEMLGVPKEDRAQIRIWSNALAHGQGLGKQDEGVKAHMQAFGEYTAKLVAEKRLHPADDLISHMIAIEEEGERLSEEELLSTITLLIFAGHETTSNLIGTGTLMLLDHPNQLEKLKADLSLVPSAVEELLRFNGPATIVGPRYATEDIEIAGQQIKTGDMLLVIPASANRDETQFTDPEELDIARKLNRHLAFGHGIHACLGKPLARLEGDIAFTTLLKRMPNLRLSVPRESITWSFSLNSRSLTALPVAF